MLSNNKRTNTNRVQLCLNCVRTIENFASNPLDPEKWTPLPSELADRIWPTSERRTSLFLSSTIQRERSTRKGKGRAAEGGESCTAHSSSGGGASGKRAPSAQLTESAEATTATSGGRCHWRSQSKGAARELGTRKQRMRGGPNTAHRLLVARSKH